MPDSSQIEISFFSRRPQAIFQTVLRQRLVPSLEGPQQYARQISDRGQFLFQKALSNMPDSYQIEASFFSRMPKAICQTVLRQRLVSSLECPKQFVRQFSDRSKFLLQKALSNMPDSSQIEISFFSRRPQAIFQTVLRQRLVPSLEGPQQYARQISDRGQFLFQKALSNMPDSYQIEASFFSRMPKAICQTDLRQK